MSRHGRDAISMLGLLSLSDLDHRVTWGWGCAVLTQTGVSVDAVSKGRSRGSLERGWVCVIYFLFRDRVSLSSLGCSETLRVDQAGCELAACLYLLGAKVKRMFHHVHLCDSKWYPQSLKRAIDGTCLKPCGNEGLLTQSLATDF